METFKIILPIVAIIISVVTITITKKNIKRQIRVAKLEEMMENFLYVSSYYFHLRILLLDLKEIIGENTIPVGESPLLLAHRKNMLSYKDKKVFETLTQKMGRVNMLSNAYLPNADLKFKIHATTHFIRQIIEALDCENLIPIHNFLNNIPHHKKFSRFIDRIQKQLITEMDLGYESIEWEKFKHYLDNDFINDFDDK